MRSANLVLAFALEVVMLAAWAWKGASLPLPDPLPWVTAAALPLAAAVVWGLFAAPRARYPLGRSATVALKALLLGGGAWALVTVGQPLWGAVDAALVALNLLLAMAWGQFGPSDRQRRLLARLEALLEDYRSRHPGEADTVVRFREFAASGETLQGRSNPRRHITASTWVVNPGRTKVLLTHHAKLNLWVQLGGHTEEGEDWAESALREAREESGLPGVRLVTDRLFDLDIHTIPARPGTPEHLHYDLRFLAEADDRLELTVSEESHNLAWVAWDDLDRFTSEESQRRMAAKTRS